MLTMVSPKVNTTKSITRSVRCSELTGTRESTRSANTAMIKPKTRDTQEKAMPVA